MLYKQIFKDDPLLPAFVDACKINGFQNNSTIAAMKFNHFEHSAFFAGIDDGKIKAFGGVHNFDIDGIRLWRVGFRGVSLYDDKFVPVISKNWRKAGVNVGILFTLQMKWVELMFRDPAFVITTNDAESSIDMSGRSHDVDLLLKRKVEGFSLMYEKINYLNTIQNVWSLDKELWHSDFNKYYEGMIKYSLDTIN
jgi:hypothetical protein